MGCGLCNRVRLSIQILENLVGEISEVELYLSEQVTPAARLLREHSARVVCSEFLGSEVDPGYVNSEGIRHEDLTHLSFDSGTFDAALSCDVLEHIPSYKNALSEFHRTLKPGGCLVVSVPFGCGIEKNLVRAIVESDGSVKHLLNPEYHGDPINPEKGALCYYHFGWGLLQDMKSAGFKDSWVELCWSSDYANIGSEQPLIIGLT